MNSTFKKISPFLTALLVTNVFNQPSALGQTVAPATDGTATQVNQTGNRFDIKGGQLSKDGANLFHSFSQFGLTAEQSANFLANPSIQNILGRVTGGNPSTINGLIQVSGGNSNLFLMNHSGIIFGNNARLNVTGSFLATTANGIGFGSNWFSASGTNDYANLIGAPSSFAFANSQPGGIINAGNLAVNSGQNLTLLGGTVLSTGELSAPGGNITVTAVPGENLVRLSQAGNILSLDLQTLGSDRPHGSSLTPASLPQLLTGGNVETANSVKVNSQGQVELTRSAIPVANGDVVAQKVTSQQATLSAANNLTLVESNLQTTGNLNLLAGNTVRVRDSATNPFVAQSGADIYIQGNQKIDILALNHPQTPFVSAGNLSLVSDGNISGDAHFTTGGKFSILNLAKEAGDFISLYDPVILASGDVSLGDYTGSSLHILAGGQVNLGNVTITSPDTTGGAIYPNNSNPLLSRLTNVTLSDGSSLVINGTTIPTLDVRSGVDWAALGGFPGNSTLGTISSSPTFGNTATNSGISIGDISIAAPDGQVFLTNRFAANPVVPAGEISTGTINLAGTNGSVVIDSKLAATTSIFPTTVRGDAIIRSTGDSFSLSFTVPSVTSARRVKLTGFISKNASNSNLFNIAYVIDLSASTENEFDGTVTVGDENRDGVANTILDGEIAGFVSLNQSLVDLGIASNTQVGVIGFASTASIADVQPGNGIQISTAPNADLNSNGIFDVVEVLRSSRYGEIGQFTPQNVGLGTNFTEGLNSTISFFNGVNATGKNNRVFFLSDGEDNTDVSNQSAVLRDPNGINAEITAVAVGGFASPDNLDLLDDNTDNDSAPVSLDPTSLRSNLQQSGITPTDISRVEILRNGVVVETIAPNQLVATPLGLQFNTSIPDAQLGTQGVEVRVVLADRDATTINASQNVQVIPNNTSFQNSSGNPLPVNIKIVSNGTPPPPPAPVNQPPIAITDEAIGAVNLPVTVSLLNNDSDPNGDKVKAVSVTQPNNGQVVLNPDGSATYTPNNGFSGTDSFTYTIADGKGGTATATATVNVPPKLDQATVSQPSDSSGSSDSSDSSGSGSSAENPNNSFIVSRSANFQVDAVVGNIETTLTNEYDRYFKKSVETSLLNLTDARSSLRQIERETGVKPAIIYAVFTPASGVPGNLGETQVPQDTDVLDLVLVSQSGNPIRKTVSGATRAKVREVAREFYTKVSDPKQAKNTSYLPSAQQLYQWIFQPLEAELQKREIQNIVFISDSGLRSIPLGALHDGKQFAIQKYSIGVAPSLSLTDTRYTNIKNSRVLAMGAGEFPADQDQDPLIAAPVEVATIAGKVWRGKPLLNQEFTLNNLRGQRERQPFGIVHLATHADFQPGDPANSYVQLYDTKIPLDEARKLGFASPGTELLVVSACRSALGDRNAELGFAGFAVQAGVKSVVASLWDVSDTGALALMTEFYRQLNEAPIKAEALRQAQIAMIQGKAKVEGNDLLTTGGKIPLSPEVANYLRRNTIGRLSHPFYWAAFTIVGSPW